jgi:hypothetical protein
LFSLGSTERRLSLKNSIEPLMMDSMAMITLLYATTKRIYLMLLKVNMAKDLVDFQVFNLIILVVNGT